MSNVLIDDTYLTDIADSIRNKLNVQTRFKPSEMANGIASISGGLGKRFTDIQTTHTTPININASDFKQGTTLRSRAFYYRGNSDKLGQYEDNIESIVFPKSGVISAPTSLKEFFYNNDTIKSVYFNGFITSNVTDLSYLFQYCNGLTYVDFGQSNTSNVTTMAFMFKGCTSLEHMDLSSLDMSNKPANGRMFEDCTNLISVILPDTLSSISYYAYAGAFFFSNCPSLQSLTILATTPPSGGYNLFGSSVNEGMKIYVPAQSVNAYKTADDWSKYVDIIYAIP